MDNNSDIANPVVNILLDTDKGSIILHVLLDTGAQFSLISLDNVYSLLPDSATIVSKPIKSLFLMENYQGKQAEFDLKLPGLNKIKQQTNTNIKQYSNAIINKIQKYNLSIMNLE